MKKILLFIIIFLNSLSLFAQNQSTTNISEMPLTLPDTKPLTWEDDLSRKMMDGAHIFIERKIDESILSRQKYWNRDFSSKDAYEKSIEPNRKRLMKYIGVIDQRLPVTMQRLSEDNNPAVIARTDKYRIYQVRWSVLDGVFGEGLLIEPKTKPLAHIIVIPDADQTPEQIVGLTGGLPTEMQFARHLAENGFQVIVPVIISRSYEFSGDKYQTHREWIYRQAFHMGRHIIGYEVQKVLAVIDWFKKTYTDNTKVGVVGYGEGGLIAFYSSAIDARIDVSLISGYFQSRQRVWNEPIYRNVWSLLHEFGDAEIASLIAPRILIIEHSRAPEVIDQPEILRRNPLNLGEFTVDGYKGQLQTPTFKSVKDEFNRIDELTKSFFQSKYLLFGENGATLKPISTQALNIFAQQFDPNISILQFDEIPSDGRKSFNPSERQQRQLKEIENHIQWLVNDSHHVRNKFFLYKVMPEFEKKQWSTALTHETYPPEQFIKKLPEYRRYFWEEVIGKFEDSLLPPNPRTRKIYDNPKWTGYEVVLDVFPDVFAWGILLIPKDIKEGEKRPLVVCQHGRNGLPKLLIEGNQSAYFSLASKLAERGFITFCPHNLYRGEDRYRWLDRKANTVKASLFSFIIAQHDQILKWLEDLPFVDGNRMAFYGLSYGGETAVRVPPLLDRYCLSICSGDFNDWALKIASTHTQGQYSFMYSIEWEMPYFDMGQTFNYAELAYLIFPRPFMVERGHHDTVAPDEWVAHEYAKVRWLYTQFNLPNKTEIEFFNGGHAINAKDTFKFLHKHLKWPEPENTQ
jgi:dienelactone hydrolase